MRTRWQLSASILFSMLALTPEAIRAAEEVSCSPATPFALAVNDSAATASAMTPVTWAPTLLVAPRTSRVIEGDAGNLRPAAVFLVTGSAPGPTAEALFQQLSIQGEVVRESISLISCSSCSPPIRCFKSAACIRAGCC